jgi:hypothetical protein
MKQRPAGKVAEQPKVPPRDDDEQELRLKEKGKKGGKKRIVGKYKPSRHSR